MQAYQSLAVKKEVKSLNDKIRIGLVDDHPLWRQGVAKTLQEAATFDVVGEGASAADAIRIARDLLPDIMLLDVSMAGGGVEAARRISMECPVVKTVMLTVSENEETVLNALKAGAKGYVLKGVSQFDLTRIVKDIYAGETYITPTLAASILLDSNSDGDNKAIESVGGDLTTRETEILGLLSKGLSNREIANELHLSERTIKHYMTNILQKLQVRNRVEAALWAQKQSLK